MIGIKGGKFMNNGDRVRTMNNEQLAKFLYFINNACSGHDCSMCPFVDSDDCDKDGFKEWLDKEVI
jgi:hypothetical protein